MMTISVNAGHYSGFPEESEKFFTLGEAALINQHLWTLSKNAGILLANLFPPSKANLSAMHPHDHVPSKKP
jgi:hypothetical protein